MNCKAWYYYDISCHQTQPCSLSLGEKNYDSLESLIMSAEGVSRN